MDNDIIDWIIVNKSLQIYNTFLKKRIHKNNKLFEFANQVYSKLDSIKNDKKHSTIIKYNRESNLPYSLNCILLDCFTFLKGNEDYKALVFPLLLVKDKIFNLEDLTNTLETEEEKESVRYIQKIYENIDRMCDYNDK
jgi:uncharacterized protein YozE (UPF0346 family)